jgi:Fe-S-cluster containining protein
MTSAISACEGCNGRCCYHYIVPVTGYDAYTIASAQNLSMEQFLTYVPEEKATAWGFCLDQTKTTYSLVLNKQRSRRKKKPCIFLISLPGGYGRCGIYPHRPLVCQTYPAVLHNGSVDIREDVACPKDSWNIAAMDLPTWRLSLLRMEMEYAIYHLIVSQWNERVKNGPAGGSYSILQYFAYLMNVYYRLEQLKHSISSEEMSLITRTWGQRPPDASIQDAAGYEADQNQTSWERFLDQVQQVIAGFAHTLSVVTERASPRATGNSNSGLEYWQGYEEAD